MNKPFFLAISIFTIQFLNNYCNAETYSVIPLPSNFTIKEGIQGKRLNDKGVVVGEINGMAAAWDMTHGVRTSSCKNSISITINDIGCVAICQNSPQQQIVLWDIDKNHLTYGPNFQPYGGALCVMNNKNKLVIHNTWPLTVIWDPKDNTLQPVSGNEWHFIDDMGNRYSNYFQGSYVFDRNSQGVMLCETSGQKSRYYNGKYYLLTHPDSRPENLRMNNLGEVVANTQNDAATGIIKWKMDGSYTPVEFNIKDFDINHTTAQILGFNSLGHILIKLVFKRSLERIVLLVPQK